MRYDDHIIDQVQASSDIVEIINPYVPLKKSGSNFKGLCPFHDEKTPSFMVSPDKQIYHCFGCGAGGNVFGFLMQYENLSFPEALRQLADRAGIKLPEKTRHGGTGGGDEIRSENEKIYEIYQHAAEYYSRLYWHAEAGKAARAYFLKRGFPDEIAREFQVGWAPAEWRGLFEHLSKKGYSEALLTKARLVNRSEKGTVYDVFRGRLMFPIHNLQGKIVAFGGRLIDDKTDGPKYLNSPENPVFVKRRELYGLWTAKRHLDREVPRIIVVEGYLDFLRLYEKGFRNVAATLGTALTSDHVTLLKRFVQEAIVLYDGDRAGQAASLRGLEVFLEGGLSVKLITLPDEYDPDEFLVEKGSDAFSGLLEKATDFFEYKLRSALAKYNPRDSLGLVKITDECFETLKKVENPLLIERYLKQLASAVNIDANSLRTEFAKFRGRQAADAQVRTARTEKPPASSAKPDRQHDTEIMMLALIIEEKNFREQAFGELEDGDFTSAPAENLFKSLRSLNQGKTDWSWPQILNRIENANFKQQLIATASFDWQAEEKTKAFSDCLRAVRKKRLLRRLDELRRQIMRAEQSGDHDLVTAFTREYQTLLQQTR